MYTTEASRARANKDSKPIKIRGWKSWLLAIVILMATAAIIFLNFAKNEEELGLAKQRAYAASEQASKPAQHNLLNGPATHSQ